MERVRIMAAGDGVIQDDGDGGVQSSGDGAAYDASGACPECCEVECPPPSVTLTLADLVMCSLVCFQFGLPTRNLKFNAIAGDIEGAYSLPYTGTDATCGPFDLSHSFDVSPLSGTPIVLPQILDEYDSGDSGCTGDVIDTHDCMVLANVLLDLNCTIVRRAAFQIDIDGNFVSWAYGSELFTSCTPGYALSVAHNNGINACPFLGRSPVALWRSGTVRVDI